jgi:hypothetical protein
VGIWPYKITARERLLLIRQAKNDDRNIRPVWFFVFDVDQSPEDEVFLQTSKHLRKFLAPIPAYFYVEMEDESDVVSEGVDRKMGITISVSRMETYRLAAVLKEAGFKWASSQYRPRAQDIFQWRNDLYEIQDTAQPKQFWGTTIIEAVYHAPAAKYRLDSSAPDSPITIQKAQPVLEYPVDFYKAVVDGGVSKVENAD